MVRLVIIILGIIIFYSSNFNIRNWILLLILTALIFGSICSHADLLQDKDGDLYHVNPNTGKLTNIYKESKYGPYKIISTNLIQDKDGDI